ncbi:yiaY [Symbiodinium sp. CCMP2592]|nr:yiaY [Symbiodinium sp. CCMP2592]
MDAMDVISASTDSAEFANSTSQNFQEDEGFAMLKRRLSRESFRIAKSLSQDFQEDEDEDDEDKEFAMLKKRLSRESLHSTDVESDELANSVSPDFQEDKEARELTLLKRRLSHEALRSTEVEVPAPKKARSEVDEVNAKLKATSEDLALAISQDLAGHTTQGAHGMNYHHKSPGDQGTTFFMPMKSLLGEGALAGAVQQIKALGHKKALIVTDAILVKVGAVKAATDVLTQAGIAFAIYDGCQPNPTVGQVEDGLEMVKSEKCDFVLSFGGGSPHDCAKAIAITATNGGDIRAMEGVDKSTKPMMTMVAVNTTAGTAAEMTRFCIITDEVRHVKMAIVDWRITPTLAVNDPTTMVGMPKSLTAATGMDALTHAIEAYVSTISNPVTDASALHAMKLISTYLPTAVEDGKNMKARDMMAYAEFLAGMAFNSASLGYVHAMAHQLGGMYNLPHGVCNAILLGPVQQYNAKYVPHLFIDIAIALGFTDVGEDQDLAVKKVLKAIRYLKNRVGIPKNLKAFKEVKVEHFPVLADNAMKDACGLTNPHQPTKEEVIALFQAAYDQEDEDTQELAVIQEDKEADEFAKLKKQLSHESFRSKDKGSLPTLLQARRCSV